jgi:hypothetical protein
MSDAISLAVPRIARGSAAVSGTLSTTGSRSPPFARAVDESPSTFLPSTSRHRNTIAASA